MVDYTARDYETDDLETLGDIEDWETVAEDFTLMIALLAEMHEDHDTVTDSVERVFEGEGSEEDLERINDAMLSAADAYFEESE